MPVWLVRHLVHEVHHRQFAKRHQWQPSSRSTEYVSFIKNIHLQIYTTCYVHVIQGIWKKAASVIKRRFLIIARKEVEGQPETWQL